MTEDAANGLKVGASAQEGDRVAVAQGADCPQARIGWPEKWPLLGNSGQRAATLGKRVMTVPDAIYRRGIELQRRELESLGQGRNQV
jgi:hypothetical protein